MADGISITAETKEVEAMIFRLAKKVENPATAMKTVQRWIKAQTMKMFRGRRPDTSGVRGVKWPKLAPSTIKQKKALVARGKALVAHRPMVRTGDLRDSIKVLEKTKTGFLFGSRKKSKKGFPYPGHHNASKFPWLFLTKQDYVQVSRIFTDYLKDQLKNFKNYTTK